MGSLRAELMQSRPGGDAGDDDSNEEMLILGTTPNFDGCVHARACVCVCVCVCARVCVFLCVYVCVCKLSGYYP